MHQPQLPNSLLEAIQKEIQKIPRHQLAAAAKDLSSKYRSQGKEKNDSLISSDAQRLAYMAVRLPATFAAVSAVLSAVQLIDPSLMPKTLKDIGAGPGTASFSCIEMFSSITNLYLYEIDSSWISIGKRLLDNFSPSKTCVWSNVNAATYQDFAVTDMTIVSYSVGELSHEEACAMAVRAWQTTSQVLIIIEPGTPRGFSYIDAIRDRLIASGANVIAPCPHQKKCPMQPPDWCHFSSRLNRTEMHLQIKEVDRGFEDEKYSYIAVSRVHLPLPQARVLRHPEHHSGHTILTLCTPEGIQKETISRKQGSLYKSAKKISWGDAFNII